MSCVTSRYPVMGLVHTDLTERMRASSRPADLEDTAVRRRPGTISVQSQQKRPPLSLVIFRSCSSILEIGFLFSFSGRRTSFGHIDSSESCSDEAVVVFPLDLRMYMLKIAVNF